MNRIANVSIIVAIAGNGAIGKENALLWHISEDLNHFKSVTMGCPVIMGRKTFESIGRPLPGRRNIVVSRDAGLSIEGCETAGSLMQAVGMCDPAVEVFIIGGGQIYRQAMDIASKLYLTVVHHHYEADTFFPVVDPEIWREVSRADFEKGTDFPYPFSFIDYVAE